MITKAKNFKEWTPHDWAEPGVYEYLREWAETSGNIPRFHGNGFVQLYVAADRRIHIWHPDINAIRVKNARIHDHRFDLASVILLGELQHISYTVTPLADGQCAIFLVPGASNKDVPLEPSSVRCIAEVREHFHLASGSRYVFKKRFFHESAADRLTMTIMDKGPADGQPARVVAPHGEAPDHAFLKQPNQTVLWSAIEDAFGTLQRAGYHG